MEKTKYVLSYDKNDKRRLKLYSKEHPLGVSIPEDLTEQFIEKLLASKARYKEYKNGVMYVHYRNTLLEIKDYELMNINRPINVRYDKSIRARKTLIGLTLAGVMLVVGAKLKDENLVIRTYLDLLDKTDNYSQESSESTYKFRVYDPIIVEPEEEEITGKDYIPTEPKVIESRIEVTLPEHERKPGTTAYDIQYADHVQDLELLFMYKQLLTRYADIFTTLEQETGISKELIAAVIMAKNYSTHEIGGPIAEGEHRPYDTDQNFYYGKTVNYYNFVTGKYETYNITSEAMSTPEGNARAYAVLLSECLSSNNYNLVAGLESYHYGTQPIKNRMQEYVGPEGDITEIPYDDLTWLRPLEQMDWFKTYSYKVLSYIVYGKPVTIKKPPVMGKTEALDFYITNELALSNSIVDKIMK